MEPHVNRGEYIAERTEVITYVFEKACAGNDYEKAIGTFYRWLDNFAGDFFKGSVGEQLKEFEQISNCYQRSLRYSLVPACSPDLSSQQLCRTRAFRMRYGQFL